MITAPALRLAAIVAVSVACGREAAPSSSGRAADSSATQTPGMATWRIDVGSVGPITIGQRLPDALLGKDLASHYLALYIADALPVDAFAYDTPAMLVILSSGPFRAQSSSTGNSAKQATEMLRDRAAAAARDGAKAEMVMVRGAGPSTAAGIGVGSTRAALATTYPDLQVTPIPETLGNDVCVATTKSLPGVRFLFESCDTRSVIRIDVVSPAR